MLTLPYAGEIGEAVVIRPLRIEDVADLEEVCYQSGILDGTLNIHSVRLLDRLRRIEGLGLKLHELVVEVDGRVVGTSRLAALQGRINRADEIAHIVVQEKFQGRGIGRQFLEALLDSAANALDLDQVELLVYPDNGVLCASTRPSGSFTKA